MVWVFFYRFRRFFVVWVSWEGGFMGGFLVGGRVFYGFVFVLGVDFFVSSRSVWWLVVRYFVCMLKKMGEVVVRVARKVNEIVESGSDILGERGCGFFNYRVFLCGLWN